MISVNQLTVAFGQRELFKEVSFFVGEKDCIGLVGRNGAGKSTMLKVFAGIQPATAGGISTPKGTRIGYLPQEMEHALDRTVMEEAASAKEELRELEAEVEKIAAELGERTDFETESYLNRIQELNDINDRLSLLGGANEASEIERILKGLGFTDEDLHKTLDQFSGGWQMRVELAKLLLQRPDMMLLDEPTNHLDIDSIEWLEQWLSNYTGAILLISHDRQFLDTVTNRTIEISAGRIYDFKHPYSKYVKLREEEREKQIQAYKNQQKYIADTQELINKFRAKKNKAAFAQTLIRKLEKLERIEVDGFDNAAMHLKFPPSPRSGKVVVSAEGVEKYYEEKHVFSGVDLIIPRLAKVALVGKNGAGKTTLTRILLGLTPTSGGKFNLGHNVEVGYYAQNQAEELDGEKTVFETIDEEAVGDMRKNVRNLLGSFLFSGEDTEKKVKVLSGGEKARLALCKLLLFPHNLLILDEPTNHLDLRSKEVLKQALINYDGTLILVSHDRDFLSGLAEHIYEVRATGLKQYIGDIRDFLLEKRAASIAEFEADRQQGAKAAPKPAAPKAEASNQKLSYEERKARKRQRRKLQNKVSKCEREIADLETRLAEMDAEIAGMDYEDQKKAQDKLHAYGKVQRELEGQMAAWEEASNALEALGDDE